MKKVFFIYLLLLLGIGIGYLLFNPMPKSIDQINFAKPSPTPYVVRMDQAENDYSASFGIITLGVPRNFTHSMYHNLSPVVFIEKSNPYIVRVKGSNITWDYFFKTLPFLLTKECLTTGTGQSYCSDQFQKLRFYINGNEDPNALNKVIHPKDKLLIIYGETPNSTEIQTQLKLIPTVE